MSKWYIDEDHHKISGTISLAKFALNQKYQLHLTKEQDWVKELLVELNQDVDMLPPEMYLRHTSLDIELTLEKRYAQTVQEFLIARGHFNATYRTQCVRTLKEMPEQLSFDFNAAFIDERYADEPEFKDQTEAFLEKEIHDLYFSKRREVNLKEMIHEYIYLNKNPYPKLPDEEDLQ